MRHLTRYETPETQDGQVDVRNTICKTFRLLWDKNPWGNAGVNTMFRDLNDTPVLLADVRVRTVSHNTYPTIMIGVTDGWVPAMKMLDWLDEHELSGFPIAYVHGFADGIYFCPIRRELKRFARVNHGGRTDRDDPADSGSCVYIPTAYFKPIKDLNRLIGRPV